MATFDGALAPTLLTDIDHVGSAVRDIEAAIGEYTRAFGITPVHRERVEDQGDDEALFAVGSSYIQPLGATGPATQAGKVLERRRQEVAPARALGRRATGGGRGVDPPRDRPAPASSGDSSDGPRPDRPSARAVEPRAGRGDPPPREALHRGRGAPFYEQRRAL